MDKRQVYYKGKGVLVETIEADLGSFVPYVRENEIREVKELNGLEIGEAVKYSFKSSNKCFSYIYNNQTLVIMGVRDLPIASPMSARLGILDGRGGVPFLLSTDKASEFKFEITRRVTPIVLEEIKKGYDFLTTWAPEYMTEMYKLAIRFGGFKVVEFVRLQSGTLCKRIAWHRNWKEVE